MTDQNQLLREALNTVQSKLLSAQICHPNAVQFLIEEAIDAINAALAQPAEGGEVFDLICNAIDTADTITMQGDYMLDSDDCIAVVRVMQSLIETLGTTPPASQEQADTVKFSGIDDTLEMGRVRRLLEAQGIHMGSQFIAQLVEAASHSQAQQPTQAWANETGLRQIECPSCGDLAVAYDPQQPSGGVVDRSDAVNLARNLIEVRECKGITPSGVRALCDAVLRMDAALLTLAAPKPEPMTEEQFNDLWETLAEYNIAGRRMYREQAVKFLYAIEAHYGIKGEA